jgi:hypothetical protein
MTYRAFVDPSGGSADSMTLAIAHTDNDRAVLDLLVERRPPFSPEAVTRDFAELLKQYHCSEVTGDRYGGEWPRERFQQHGVTYRLAEQPRSELYRALLPLVNSGQVDLLDDARLMAQLVGLERRVGRSGRDSIDHGVGGHDDVANAAAGALVLASSPDRPPFLEFARLHHEQMRRIESSSPVACAKAARPLEPLVTGAAPILSPAHPFREDTAK